MGPAANMTTTLLDPDGRQDPSLIGPVASRTHCYWVLLGNQAQS